LKQRLNFSDKKELQLWSDLLKFQAEKSLKQRLVFSRKNGFQLWPDFFQIQAKKSLNQKIFETTVGFLREKRIAIMVRFSSHSR